MVLLAGIGTPKNLRIRRSRIFRAPQLGCSCFTFKIKVFHLKRKLTGVTIWTAASISEPLNTAFLITIEDLVAGLAGDTELLHSSAIGSPASRRATNCNLSSITEHSFQGITPSSLEEESVTHVSGTKRYLCLEPLTSGSMI